MKFLRSLLIALISIGICSVFLIDAAAQNVTSAPQSIGNATVGPQGFLRVITEVQNGCGFVGGNYPHNYCSANDPEDFTMEVYGFLNNAYSPLSDPFPGDSPIGWVLNVTAGTQYKVTEIQPGPYAFGEEYSPGCRSTMTEGVEISCTVKNTFPKPHPVTNSTNILIQNNATELLLH